MSCSERRIVLKPQFLSKEGAVQLVRGECHRMNSCYGTCFSKDQNKLKEKTVTSYTIVYVGKGCFCVSSFRIRKIINLWYSTASI